MTVTRYLSQFYSSLKSFSKPFFIGLAVTAVLSILFWAQPTYAQAVPGLLNVDLDSFMQPEGFSSTVGLLIMMSSITLLPFFLITSTSFLRVIIVLSMLRGAVGTQSAPPNPAMIGLAIFMTIFIMTPTINRVVEEAVKPYQEGVVTQKEAIELGIQPFRDFMVKQVSENDLALFLEYSKVQYTDNIDEVPIFIIIPSFVLSELKTAFQIGFLLYIPFLVVDLIISNILLSLGMFMLSPAMISTPFKILLFVMTDGWNLVVKGVLMSFQ